MLKDFYTPMGIDDFARQMLARQERFGLESSVNDFLPFNAWEHLAQPVGVNPVPFSHKVEMPILAELQKIFVKHLGSTTYCYQKNLYSRQFELKRGSGDFESGKFLLEHFQFLAVRHKDLFSAARVLRWVSRVAFSFSHSLEQELNSRGSSPQEGM
jgi:hypothetical protein